MKFVGGERGGGGGQKRERDTGPPKFLFCKVCKPLTTKFCFSTKSLVSLLNKNYRDHRRIAWS